MTSSNNIQQVYQVLERLVAVSDSNLELQGFDMIEVPFELTQACVQLWIDFYSEEMIKNLAESDPEALEAWAIGLSTTLQVQLGVLYQWLPLLNSLTLPQELAERINQRATDLKETFNEKSVLLQTAMTASLNASLTEGLKKLGDKQDEYEQQWEKLQQMVATCNLYDREIQAIRDNLNTHYRTNVALGQHLPVDPHRIESLTQIIQAKLAELDCELQTAQARHEQLRRKQYITFGSQP